MIVVMSFCGLCLLLIVGKILRMHVPLFQKLYLPSSVIGGGVGLLLISVFGKQIPGNWTAGWGQIPSFLINVVFAGLFLGVATPGIRKIWKVTAPQLCYGQIVAWGQYLVGILVVVLLLKPLFHVEPAFAALIEMGFEGGHGTVAGLVNTFDEFGWTEGKDLGFTVATVGMITGVVLGMWLVNLAVKRGWVKNIRLFEDQSHFERKGIYPDGKQPPAGKQTVASDSIDSLALHVAIIGLAITLGYLIRELLILINSVAPEGVRELKFLASFPLFPLCMIGGLIRAEGKVVAFTLGERLTEDTFDVHFEKAYADVQGAYAMINREFVRRELSDYTYINREEDMGIPGLRQAKLSYQPDSLVEKGIVTKTRTP